MLLSAQRKELFKRSFILVLVSLPFFWKMTTLGQVSNAVSPFYWDYFLNQNTVFPSYFDKDERLSASIQHKSYFGPLSILKTFHGHAEYSTSSGSQLGLEFHSEHEGPYFTRNRMRFLYHNVVRVKEDIELALGAKLGYISYSYGESTGSPGGNAGTIDLALGAHLRIAGFQLGFSGHQLPDAFIQPIDVPFNLVRYYELLASYEFSLNPFLTYSPRVRWRWSQANERMFSHSHLLFFQENRWFVGAHHLWSWGVSPTAGIRVPTQKDRSSSLDLSFSFFLATSEDQVAKVIQSSYEFGLWYTLSK